MTVDEIRILKIKLESDMENTLNYFERRTNTRVESVDLVIHPAMVNGERINDVKIKAVI